MRTVNITRQTKSVVLSAVWVNTTHYCYCFVVARWFSSTVGGRFVQLTLEPVTHPFCSLWSSARRHPQSFLVSLHPFSLILQYDSFAVSCLVKVGIRLLKTRLSLARITGHHFWETLIGGTASWPPLICSTSLPPPTRLEEPGWVWQGESRSTSKNKLIYCDIRVTCNPEKHTLFFLPKDFLGESSYSRLKKKKNLAFSSWEGGGGHVLPETKLVGSWENARPLIPWDDPADIRALITQVNIFIFFFNDSRMHSAIYNHYPSFFLISRSCAFSPSCKYSFSKEHLFSNWLQNLIANTGADKKTFNPWCKNTLLQKNRGNHDAIIHGHSKPCKCFWICYYI